VGADGADSWVRVQAGLQADTLLYGEMGVVANFECEKPHHNTAFQWFRPDGVLAWLPLPGNRISVVWSTPEAHARTLLGLDEASFCQRIAEAGGNRLGALTLLTPPAAFPLRLMRMPRIVAKRLALIGDAAHAIHPLSGHGINLGFLDARELAQALRELPDHTATAATSGRCGATSAPGPRRSPCYNGPPTDCKGCSGRSTRPSPPFATSD
jgi:2-octaprenylphenol hydroxylase